MHAYIHTYIYLLSKEGELWGGHGRLVPRHSSSPNLMKCPNIPSQDFFSSSAHGVQCFGMLVVDTNLFHNYIGSYQYLGAKHQSCVNLPLKDVEIVGSNIQKHLNSSCNPYVSVRGRLL